MGLSLIKVLIILNRMTIVQNQYEEKKESK